MTTSEHCDALGLMPLANAIETILNQVKMIEDTESVDLYQANKRVLADNLFSAIDVPPADNSAMDGYALRCEDLAEHDTLTLVGHALAGVPFAGHVESGQCVRIMTGAIIPTGANSVVMQENTHVAGKTIHFLQRPHFGNSVRKAGEDIACGELIIEQGTLLTPAHLALLASIGLSRVKVTRQLLVGLIATGDELTLPGKQLKAGGIFESNSYALSAMLADANAKTINYGIISDDKTALRAVFEQANTQCDLVISCGGVSVGDADYVKEILTELGTINFWKVAIKPGKPFAFGRLSKAYFCGLPGNPVSSYVTFEQLVMPLLKKLAGQRSSPANQYMLAKTTSKIKKRPGRADFQRGYYYRDERAELKVTVQANQSSGVMSSLTKANCYILLDQQQGDVREGEEIKILPFAFI